MSSTTSDYINYKIKKKARKTMLLLIKGFGLFLIPIIIIFIPLMLATVAFMDQQNSAVINNEDNIYLPFSEFVFTSGWGSYDPYGNGVEIAHRGVDLAAPKDTEVFAGIEGTVIQANNSCDSYGGYLGNSCGYGWGNYVMIQAGDITIVYGHMSDVKVKVDEQVKIGQTIGVIGNSGNSSGLHLHMEVRMNGVDFNFVPNLSLNEKQRIDLVKAVIAESDQQVALNTIEQLSRFRPYARTNSGGGLCLIETAEDLTTITSKQQLINCDSKINSESSWTEFYATLPEKIEEEDV